MIVLKLTLLRKAMSLILRILRFIGKAQAGAFKNQARSIFICFIETSKVIKKRNSNTRMSKETNLGQLVSKSKSYLCAVPFLSPYSPLQFGQTGKSTRLTPGNEWYILQVLFVLSVT